MMKKNRQYVAIVALFSAALSCGLLGSATFAPSAVAQTKKAANGPATATATVTVAPPKVPDLVAWYRLDGDGRDSSGLGMDAQVDRAVATADRAGTPAAAMHFDGVNAVVTARLSPVFDLTTYTLAAFVKFAAYPPPPVAPAVESSFMVIAKGQDGGNYRLKIATRFGFQGGTYLDLLQKDAAGGNNGARAWAAGLFPGRWFHIAATRDATTAKLYVNGVLKASAELPLPRLYPNDRVMIGGSQNGGYFNGDIDEVRIYSRVLTRAEIAALAQ